MHRIYTPYMTLRLIFQQLLTENDSRVQVGADCLINMQGWPGLYIYTVYDCIFGHSPAKNVVFAPYVDSSGQPFFYANPLHIPQHVTVNMLGHGAL